MRLHPLLTLRTKLAANALFAAALLIPQASFAQHDVTTDIKTNGTQGSITISDPAVTKATFSAVAKGNVSHFIELSATGPAGLKGYVEVRQIKRGGKLGAMYRLQFPKKKNGFTTELIDGSSSAYHVTAAVETTPDQLARIKKATGLSEATIKILLNFQTEEQIIAKYGKDTSPADPTSGGGGTTPSTDNPTPKTEPGSLAGVALLNKDACDKSTSGYKLDFVIDLSGVDRAAAGNTFTVSAGIDASESEASPGSIKPVSDGKFAPKPLILIQSPGYSYSSKPTLNLIQWKNGRPGKAKALKIEDYVYYRGQRLARAIAAGVLNGGKGTFEIAVDDEVGTACFNLVRTRQRVNGYKGGD